MNKYSSKTVEELETLQDELLERKLSIEYQIGTERESREKGVKPYDAEFYSWLRRARVALRRTLIEYRELRRYIYRRRVQHTCDIIGVDPKDHYNLLANCLTLIRSLNIDSDPDVQELVKAIDLYLKVYGNTSGGPLTR